MTLFEVGWAMLLVAVGVFSAFVTVGVIVTLTRAIREGDHLTLISGFCLVWVVLAVLFMVAGGGWPA